MHMTLIPLCSKRRLEEPLALEFSNTIPKPLEPSMDWKPRLTNTAWSIPKRCTRAQAYASIGEKKTQRSVSYATVFSMDFSLIRILQLTRFSTRSVAKQNFLNLWTRHANDTKSSRANSCSAFGLNM
jgi:hypothetical protein